MKLSKFKQNSLSLFELKHIIGGVEPAVTCSANCMNGGSVKKTCTASCSAYDYTDKEDGIVYCDGSSYSCGTT